MLVDGQDIATYSTKQLTAYRRDDIGFVFQFYNLDTESDGTGECGACTPDM